MVFAFLTAIAKAQVYKDMSSKRMLQYNSKTEIPQASNCVVSNKYGCDFLKNLKYPAAPLWFSVVPWGISVHILGPTALSPILALFLHSSNHPTYFMYFVSLL